jgi:hypothetical protein
MQFIARDQDGYALAPEDIAVEFILDDEPVDNESILQEGSEELSASIHLGLVLDASYSMLLHEPPAFTPMLEAARDAVQQGLDLYVGRPGTFSWDLAWFHEYIFYPDPEGRAWTPGDIVTIPAPESGTATKLFAAVTHQARKMTAAHESVANGPNDHHVLVVFSDGADNYSYWDNADQVAQGETSSFAPYVRTGFATTDQDTAVAAITGHPDLITHVIGLGSAVRDDQLQALADAGGGRYFKNPSSSEVGTVFDLVIREFATLQTQGATIPLPPGDYTFKLRVLADERRASDEVTFRFHAGDGDAGLLR